MPIGAEAELAHVCESVASQFRPLLRRLESDDPGTGLPKEINMQMPDISFGSLVSIDLLTATLFPEAS